MFEQPAGKEEKDRSRLIMIVSGVAVVAVVLLIILVSSYGKRTTTVTLSRPGSPEFDSYAKFITFKNIETSEGERFIGRYVRVQGWLHNEGDRTLDRLEVRIYCLGHNQELVKEKNVMLVPTIADRLEPGARLHMDLYLDQTPDPATIQPPKIELSGFKLR